MQVRSGWVPVVIVNAMYQCVIHVWNMSLIINKLHTKQIALIYQLSPYYTPPPPSATKADYMYHAVREVSSNQEPRV